MEDTHRGRAASRRWRSKFGRSAEQYVALRLEAEGIRLLGRNHRCRGGEIDLIGLDGRALVFFEVKARQDRGDRFGSPAQAVGPRKQARLLMAARDYLRCHPLGPNGAVQEIRFDIVQVRSHRGRLQIEWIRDAFRPGAW